MRNLTVVLVYKVDSTLAVQLSPVYPKRFDQQEASELQLLAGLCNTLHKYLNVSLHYCLLRGRPDKPFIRMCNYSPFITSLKDYKRFTVIRLISAERAAAQQPSSLCTRCKMTTITLKCSEPMVYAEATAGAHLPTNRRWITDRKSHITAAGE